MATIFTSNYDGGYGNRYEFKAEASESNVSTANNTSLVSVDIYVRRTDSSSSGAYNNDGTAWSITIDGTTTTGTSAWDTRNSTDWKYLGSASKTITHNSDGSRTITISASHTGNSSSGSSRMGNASGSGNFTLTQIARQANFISCAINSIGLDTVDIAYSLDKAVSAMYVSVNGGEWQSINVVSGNWTTNAVIRVSNLSYNTAYNFRLRANVNGLDTITNYMYATTKDIARISNLENFEHGINVPVTITNPADIANLILNMLIGDTLILSRTVQTGENIINFSDEELDKLYNEYGKESSLNATFNLLGSGYTDSKTCLVTLTGNQKTARVNVNGIYRRGKTLIKLNNEWKKAVIWIKVNGIWNRSI